ncbi:MAG TPA: VIT family protein [Steroidobacteraceae bacterium]|jgi:VIT1/CCC1 family predicted Fe2+/Mn2+ transporter|nr:VIT family protein [Steroidobacteraceae bacterium]
MRRRHFERHFVNRVGWLRAAVLGANDGIVSVGSLLVGIAATPLARAQILLVGIAGLLAGAASMAAGEFVSVSTQADSERSDLERERQELAREPRHEHMELAGIYVQRGLTPALADQVATQLMAHDALGAHARDELGLSATSQPRPLQAALASGASFTAGALFSLVLVLLAPRRLLVPVIAGASLLALAILGTVSARTGGAPIASSALRVTLWGAFAMALTAAAGFAFSALG